ncbi:kinase-like protein [Gigaspora margarita]|uniref:Kinase-like protein n=1 Tax=Gigaspora margarita TaxID=4874 RepID=A0A8H3XH22_GIGMA|nr:kinase-like protein [Gigaspora margarita]
MDSLEWLEKSINERHINFYDYDDFINKEKTNEGGFGTIQKAEWKGYGLTVALKSLKVNKNLDKLVKELQLLRSVSLHPNINLLYGLTKDPIDEHYVLILQFANEGNLREYLRKNFKELKWTDKYRIGKEISQGLLFLHNNNIVHRDLHSKNILVHERKMMIADFGVIFWEISSGRPPFQSFTSREAIVIHIFRGSREIPVEDTPQKYLELYTKCWDEIPNNRPEIKQVYDTLNSWVPESVSSTINTENSLKGLLDNAISQHQINNIQYSEFTVPISIRNFSSTYKSEWDRVKLTVVFKTLRFGSTFDENTIQDSLKQFKILQRASFHQNIIHLYGVTKNEDLNSTNILVHDKKAKIAANDKSLKENIIREFINKLEILQKITFHSNVINFYGITKDSNGHYNTVLQFVAHCNLHYDTSYKRDMRSDIYSLGVILWEISSNRPPFPSSHSVKLGGSASISKRIFKGERETPIEGTPPRYIQLYKQCWDNEPTRRPGISLILNTLTNIIHPTIK